MKRLSSILLVFLLMFSGFGLNKASAAQFSDVPNTQRFYDDIIYLMEKNVLQGKGTKLGVDDKITREEVAIMISKSLGLDGKQTSTKFKDVPSTLASSGYINSAVREGIISGYPNDLFKPKQIVNRGEMAIMLSRAFDLTVEANKNFKDMTSKVSSYKEVRRIVQAEITTGYPDGTFKPNETLTRGQISAFLARAMIQKETGNKKALVHFINVGQGDSILIQSGNGKNMLIDGGTKSQGSKVVTFLKSKGVTKLDVVVATHPDADHIGGLISVVNSFAIGKFIDSGKAHTTETYLELLQLIDAKGIPFEVPSVGQKITLDKAWGIEVLNADSTVSDNNDASIVLKAKYGKVSFLLTGDAGIALEQKMLSKYDVTSTYLKAGHHGSNTSSSAAFIKAVNPEGTILSYGKANSYGHPHSEIVARLHAISSKIYTTADSGDITVTTNGSTHSVSAKPMAQPTPPAPKPVPKPVPTPPAPKPTPTPKPDLGSGLYVIPGAPTSFQNCTAMKKHYPNGVKKGHPAYASKHDRDKDNWACE